MPQFNRYLQFLTALLPAGAFGLSVALAASIAKATPAEDEKPSADGAAGTFSMAAELQAIRDAVDEASSENKGGRFGQTGDPDIRLAWWGNGNGRGWGNAGRVWGNAGHPGWANARPWGNGWGNGGGWRNGGWRNGGGWHNWHNGGWRN